MIIYEYENPIEIVFIYKNSRFWVENSVEIEGNEVQIWPILIKEVFLGHRSATLTRVQFDENVILMLKACIEVIIFCQHDLLEFYHI